MADEQKLRTEVGVAVARIVGALADLDGALSALRELTGPDERVLEAALAARMASTAIAPLGDAWPKADNDGDGMAATVGAVLRHALAAGQLHVATQAGLRRPCVPGVTPADQGLKPSQPDAGADSYDAETTSAPAYWLADRGELGALGLPGADLVALIKAQHVAFAGQSERRLLRAVLDSGALLADPRHPDKWSQLVKLAGKARRVVVIPAELAFPSLSQAHTPPPGRPRPTSTAGCQVVPDPQPAPASEAPPATADADQTPASRQIPSWLTDRVASLPGATRSQLLAKLDAAGLVGRHLNHDELVTAERWLIETERTVPADAQPRPTARQPTGPQRRPKQPPATATAGAVPRYRYLATDGHRLISATVANGGGPWQHAGQLVDDARQLVPTGEIIIAIHPAAHFILGLPERLGERDNDGLRHAFARDAVNATTSVREVGASGGLIIERAGQPRTQLLFPGYSSEFAGAATAEGLLEAIELFCQALDFGYSYSAASTLHRMIEFTQGRGKRLGPPSEYPDLRPPFAVAGYSVPATTWTRPMTPGEAVRPWVIACDRSGSYLAAWGSCALSDGSWTHHPEPFPLPASTDVKRTAGYWRLNRIQLADITPEELPDPFLRHGAATESTVWVTTPLAELAAELAEDRQLTVEEAWIATETIRPLDRAASRLAKARGDLLADDRSSAAVALDTLKEGYAAATSWFEFGPRPPSPLYRPHWRHTILDRYVANTWRNLAKAKNAPFALTDVDAALFAVDNPNAIPDGLRSGTGLGAWKTKGGPVTMAAAAAALRSAGARAVVRLAETS